MRSVSDVLHNHGGNIEFTTKDGKVLKVQYLTLKGMSQYENKLQNRAIAKLSEQKDVLPKETFNQMFTDVLDKIASGFYAFGSEVCTKSLSTIHGVTDLVSILCDVSPDEALELLVSEGDSFKKLVDDVLRKSIGSKDDEVNNTGGNV